MKTKRRDNKGRILRTGEQQRKDKTYMYRWTDSLGKRNTIYGKTLEELREEEDRIQKEISVGMSRTAITLNQQIEEYLETKTNLANSTLENYKYYYCHCIKNNRIGEMRVSDIVKSDILLFYKELKNKGFSVGSIKILHKIIRPALQLACDNNIVLKNYADGCTKDYQDVIEKKFALTLEEEQEFLARVKERPRMRRYHSFYALLLKTGLRISEAIGLTWTDVDMEKRTISINHQVQYRKVGNKTMFYATKTKTNAGTRLLPMTEEVYQLFLEQRKIWFKTTKDTEFEVDGYRDFVFLSHVTGRCMNPSNVRRMMHSLVAMNDERDIKIPEISPHILRHTYCTRLAESGIDIKVLQYLMGQTDIKTTMRVYNHVDLNRVSRELAKMESTDTFTPIFTPIGQQVV